MLPQEFREIETLGRCTKTQDQEEGLEDLLALFLSCNCKSGVRSAQVLLETEFKREYHMPLTLFKSAVWIGEEDHFVYYSNSLSSLVQSVFTAG